MNFVIRAGSIAGILLIVLAVRHFTNGRAMHLKHVAQTQQKVIEWKGYEYQQRFDTTFEVEGVVASISPNGGVFCSGPFEGGPGMTFVLRQNNGAGRRSARDFSFAAFGDERTEPALHTLQLGSHVRLTGTLGPVNILRDGQVVQKVEPNGHWLSRGAGQEVIVVKRLESI
jgi:hypothetical protein